MSEIIRIDQLVDGQRFGRFNLSLLLWSFLAMFADGYDITALSYAAPVLQKLWHVPKENFGVVMSAHLFGILFGAPLFGLWGDRRGRRSAIVAGSVIYGVASLGVVWTHSVSQIELLRFVTGLGLGGIMPNTIALNSELAPRRLRATLVTLMFVGITVGSSMPGLVVAPNLLPRYGWTVLFFVGGLVPLAVALGLALRLPESVKYLALRPHRRRELLRISRRMRPDLRLSEDAQFLPDSGAESPGAAATALSQIFKGSLGRITPLLWLCFATALMSNFFLNSFLPLIFSGHIDARHAAIAAGLYSVGGTVGGVLMSALLDRFGVVVIAALFAVSVPAIAALGWVQPSFGPLAVLTALAGLGVLGAQFGNNAAAGLLYPTGVRAKGVGWALGIGRFGAILGPLLGARLLGLPARELFLAAAAPMLVGAVAACVLLVLCYRRLGGLHLSDIPAQEGEPPTTPVGSISGLSAREGGS